ncbi:MAG TPA: hypothetical protein ACFYD3_06435 [Candidatus Hypogeohydataceae bacterium YC41]
MRQYINSIRKASPPPYNDPHHPEAISRPEKWKAITSISLQAV